MEENRDYPARITIDPPGEMSRIAVLFRLVLIIPIFIIYNLVSGHFTPFSHDVSTGEHLAMMEHEAMYDEDHDQGVIEFFERFFDDDDKKKKWMGAAEHHDDMGSGLFDAGLFSGVLVIPTLLMILFRRKYPRWWFDFNRELISFFLRIFSYMLLIQNEYPSTDA